MFNDQLLGSQKLNFDFCYLLEEDRAKKILAKKAQWDTGPRRDQPGPECPEVRIDQKH